MRQAFAALPASERVQANDSPYVMVGGDAGIPADTKMFDALYLGYVRYVRVCIYAPARCVWPAQTYSGQHKMAHPSSGAYFQNLAETS